MQFKKLLIVIPTRNRADLAMRSIQSVLNQKDCEFELVVSDNSTDDEESKSLKNFCDNLRNEKLHYIRPPVALPMSKHWNWAMEYVLANHNFSHITYLTDRMLFIDGGLAEIQRILTQCEEKIVSYSTAGINDSSRPFILEQLIWSGRLFEIKSSEIIKQFADMKMLYHPVPRMMNCFVPLNVVKEVTKKFGNCFSSISPDFNFAFRVLALFDSTMFYDKSLLIQFGGNRSNGVNLMRGIKNKDTIDFMNNSNVSEMNFETPINEFFIMPNPIMYEYYAVKQNIGSDKFPEMNKNKYLMSLVEGINSFQNKEISQEINKRLNKGIGKFQYLKFSLSNKVNRKIIGLQIRIQKALFPESSYYLRHNFDTFEEAKEYANRFPRKPYFGKDIMGERIGSFTHIKIVE